MGALQQVLVIDDGVRAVDHSLAAELAERGFASVTVSLEAADEVLAVIARPAAILLHTPAGEASAFEARTLALRERMARAGIPVVIGSRSAERAAQTATELAEATAELVGDSFESEDLATALDGALRRGDATSVRRNGALACHASA